jgi:hypothetical protein
MNPETEEQVAQALDTVLAPYRKELLALTPGERILLACDLSEICRVVAIAVDRATAPPD